LCSLVISIVISAIKGFAITDKTRMNLINEGVKRGQTVKAKLIKSQLVRPGFYRPQSYDSDIYLDKGTYQYEFNGKTYKTTRYEKQGYLKKEIEIVHTKNLGRFYRRTRIYWFKYFIISFLILLILQYAK